MTQILDAQTISLIGNETLAINSRVYAAMYPNFDYARLISVDTSGGEWSNGVETYFTDFTGEARWQSLGAKDVPVVSVSQSATTRKVLELAVGYDWHIGETQRVANSRAPAEIFNVVERRARAAREVAERKIYEITLLGDSAVGYSGMLNYSGVTTTTAAADGTGGVTWWVDAAGVGTKTPAQIVRDINVALSGVSRATLDVVLANTLLIPQSAMEYIAATPYSATTMETILSFIMRTNRYTLETGQPLTIRGLRELETAAAGGTTGRMVAYFNSPEYAKLHLNMPFNFLPQYQDGPFSFKVPGLARTGGVEFLSEKAVRYVDGISQPPA